MTFGVNLVLVSGAGSFDFFEASCKHITVRVHQLLDLVPLFFGQLFSKVICVFLSLGILVLHFHHLFEILSDSIDSS
jgi:hypothetical protein